MQRVFDSQNKRLQQFNLFRNHVDHQNSIFILNFLPRPEFDKIGERFKFETKRDEISQQRSSKRDTTRH